MLTWSLACVDLFSLLLDSSSNLTVLEKLTHDSNYGWMEFMSCPPQVCVHQLYLPDGWWVLWFLCINEREIQQVTPFNKKTEDGYWL